LTLNLYRLQKPNHEATEEWYGYFETDKEAIDAFILIFNDQNEDKYWYEWKIQQLGYMKPDVVIEDLYLPWKEIHVICKGK
jgi:hypothetical protein